MKKLICLSKAAESGDAFAQYKLGVLNRNGKGVEENDRQAVRWYRMAAEQGHANAQYNMGFMYRNYQGIDERDESAINEQIMKWYGQAARQGHRDAQFFLALMYATGEAGIQNDVAHTCGMTSFIDQRHRAEKSKHHRVRLSDKELRRLRLSPNNVCLKTTKLVEPSHSKLQPWTPLVDALNW